jgi:hypothetical protein
MVLFLLSEIIGENTSLKTNSIFGTFRNFLKGEAIKSKREVDKLLTDEN